MLNRFDAFKRRPVLAACVLLLLVALASGDAGQAASGAAPAGAAAAPAPRIQAGQEAPVFSMRSPDGARHSPADLRGIVRHVRIDQDYTQRPSNDELLEALRKLRPGSAKTSS